MPTIEENFSHVRKAIAAAEQRFGRAGGAVRLLAVSKGHPAETLRLAVERAGQREFGESQVQEALPKVAALSDHDLTWHFIGPIQSNKTRDIARHFQWAHGVDRIKIARRLDDQRPAEMPPLNVCIQVNASGEATKSGVAITEVPALAEAISRLPRLRLRGLMAIPPPLAEFSRQRDAFRQIREAQARLVAQGWPLDTLSMGMSGDMEAAIAEGATIVRIGRALFGARPP